MSNLNVVDYLIIKIAKINYKKYSLFPYTPGISICYCTLHVQIWIHWHEILTIILNCFLNLGGTYIQTYNNYYIYLDRCTNIWPSVRSTDLQWMIKDKFRQYAMITSCEFYKFNSIFNSIQLLYWHNCTGTILPRNINTIQL